MTKTAAKRRIAFEKAFKKLLKKHKATFEISGAYGEGRATITMHDEYDGIDVLAEFTEFDLESIRIEDLD